VHKWCVWCACVAWVCVSVHEHILQLYLDERLKKKALEPDSSPVSYNINNCSAVDVNLALPKTKLVDAMLFPLFQTIYYHSFILIKTLSL
jgi:hypothetical protein